MILWSIYILASIVFWLSTGSLASFVYTARKFAQYRKQGLTNVTKLKSDPKEWADSDGARFAFFFGPVVCVYYLITYLCSAPFRLTQRLAANQSLAAEKQEARRKAIEQQQKEMDEQLNAMLAESLKELESRDSVERILGIQQIQGKGSIVSR